MKLFKLLFARFHNLILYGIIGSFTSFLDFCVFTVLSNYIGIYYLVANCISVLVGITTSFLLNRKYNFKVRDKVPQRFAMFLCVGICGLMLSNLILYIGIDLMRRNETLVKLASIVLVVGFQFLLNKFITFRVNNKAEI